MMIAWLDSLPAFSPVSMVAFYDALAWLAWYMVIRRQRQTRGNYWQQFVWELLSGTAQLMFYQCRYAEEPYSVALSTVQL